MFHRDGRPVQEDAKQNPCEPVDGLSFPFDDGDALRPVRFERDRHRIVEELFEFCRDEPSGHVEHRRERHRRLALVACEHQPSLTEEHATGDWFTPRHVVGVEASDEVRNH